MEVGLAVQRTIQQVVVDLAVCHQANIMDQVCTSQQTFNRHIFLLLSIILQRIRVLHSSNSRIIMELIILAHRQTHMGKRHSHQVSITTHHPCIIITTSLLASVGLHRSSWDFQVDLIVTLLI